MTLLYGVISKYSYVCVRELLQVQLSENRELSCELHKESPCKLVLNHHVDYIMIHRVDYIMQHHVGTYYLTMYNIQCIIASLHSGSSSQLHTESSRRIYSVSPRNLNSGSSCSLHIESSHRLHSESSRGLRKESSRRLHTESLLQSSAVVMVTFPRKTHRYIQREKTNIYNLSTLSVVSSLIYGFRYITPCSSS
jgi:hypothetical protein